MTAEADDAALPSFRLTQRDQTMLEAIAQYRYLSSPQLHRIAGGSERGIRNRLRLLTAHALLNRRAPHITEPFAYGLTRQGARLLAERGIAIDYRQDWTATSRTTALFLNHTLAIAETMLHFRFATAVRSLGLVDHDALLPHMPQLTQNARDPFALRTTLRQGGKELPVAVIPDRLFALVYPDARHHFALEQDMGSMDIWASRLVGKSSMRRKLLAYARAREQNRFIDTWNFRSFRVLTVTTSESRIRTMLEAQRKLAVDCPPGLFLYSTVGRIAKHGALGPAWTTSKRDNVSLQHEEQPLF
jgi:hypothetical protein